MPGADTDVSILAQGLYRVKDGVLGGLGGGIGGRGEKSP